MLTALIILIAVALELSLGLRLNPFGRKELRI